MDDSTPHGYLGDADGAASGPLVGEDRQHKDLENLRTFGLRELAERVLEEA